MLRLGFNNIKKVTPLAASVVFVTLLLLACVSEGNQEGTAMQNGFSWVIDQQLAGMPRPGTASDLEQDLAFLAEQGVDLLVSLTEDPLDSAFLTGSQIESVHLPLADFHPPTLEQQIEFVERTSQKINGGGRVGVHCTAGMGRTGTMLATYLVYLGSSPQEAIAKVRELRPGSIETAEQEAAIRTYWEHLQHD